MSDDSSDLSDDIVPEVPYHGSRLRQFLPWHKVRKEYIRKEQWNKFIIRYADRYLRNELQDSADTNEWSVDDDVEIPDSIAIDRPLRCLVIPGDDLLDIRSLHRDTEGIQCYIRYLGFNYRQGSQQQGTRVHVAHNEVASSHRVHNDSIVLPDSFQAIANPQSQAYRYVKQLGPFHVVNLDLCDSLFPNADCNIEAYFNGLLAIAAYQMKAMASPWLLFLTTEVAPKEVDANQFDKLCGPTKANLRAHTQFAEAFSHLVPMESVGSSEQPVDCSLLSEQQMIDLFGVAVGKALLSFCSSAGESWKVEMRGSHIYTIHPDKKVAMLSLAFQFTPIAMPPQDATGLSTLKFDLPRPFDEVVLAIKLVTSVKNISNIDSILAADAELHRRLLQSSADLLDSAGYDRNAYLQWVSDGEGTV